MKVLTFEEHSSVLPEWWRRQVRARTLVYLDAHLDLQYVNGERLGHLEQCTTVQAVKRLEKPHHLLPDRDFSYSIEDFLYPAHRLGMIDRLIWVAPPHVETGYSEVAISQLEQMEGMILEELTSFKKVSGGWIEGRLLGLDITICSYLQLEMLPLPVDSLIDIDTDYFVAVPGDEAWVNPRNVCEVLNRLSLKPEFITISRSVSSGFMPLRYRYFADYLAALWEQRHQDSAHYEQLFHLEHQLRLGDTQSAVTGCQRELERYPRCAASYYLLSLSEHDPDKAKQYQRRAADLCSSYRSNVLRSACEIPNRQLTVHHSTVLALEKQLTETRQGPEEQALVQVALGLIYCACGQLQGAYTHYQQCTQQLGHHAELALEIGKLLLQSQQAEQAIPFLKTALQSDKTRVAAHVFLAGLYGKQGSLAQALQHLETAREMTPAWGQILSMLAEIHRQLGNHQRSQTLLEQYQHQRLQTRLLAQQLSDHTVDGMGQ